LLAILSASITTIGALSMVFLLEEKPARQFGGFLPL
jgi:hypothetical protein